MSTHVYDLSEKAPHEVVAAQLRALADQFQAGQVDLAYEEWHAPTAVVDPVDVTIDLKRNRHHVELSLLLRWPTPEDASR